MNQEQRNRYIGGFTGILCICLYICAVMFHDIPSYEQNYLHGAALMLHWCMVLYLPLFPLLSGFIAIAASNKVTAIGVTTINFFLTLIFMAFSWASGILFASWLFLTVASLFTMLIAYYDKTNRTNSNK